MCHDLWFAVIGAGDSMMDEVEDLKALKADG